MMRKEITDPICESDRNDTVGNCFSCINLVKWIKEKKLSYVDDCKKSKGLKLLKLKNMYV